MCQKLVYWQKKRSTNNVGLAQNFIQFFPVRSYGKTQMNFLAKSIDTAKSSDKAYRRRLSMHLYISVSYMYILFYVHLHMLLPSLCITLVVKIVKNLPAIQETLVQSLGWEDPLKKEMTTHSNILAQRSPWTEELGRLQSIGSQRVRHD